METSLFLAVVSFIGLDGARSTGQVAVFRTADHPPFASHDLRAARDLEPRVHRDLRAAARLARPPRERMVWMIDPTGGVQLRSASMDVPPAVAGHLQRLEARGDRSGSWFDGRQAFAATRMNGCAGAAWLVTATPLATLLIGPIAHLSQPQRQVAAIVARGATVAEAASALCRSENTVRSHLKAVYAACGIRTRAELVRMVDTWALPAPLDTTGSA